MEVRKNQKGITLIALIVTIIVLIIIAGISIATLTADNGVLRQVNSAKVSNIEGTAKEQMNLAASAMRIAIAEAAAQDNSYRANKNVTAIQNELYEMLVNDTTALEANGWKKGTTGEGTFTITYEGDDYKNACNDDAAVITYTITLAQRSIEVTDVATGIKGADGSDISIDIGAENGNGGGSGGSTPVTPPTTSKKLSEVASIGDYVNYDPTNVSAENADKTTYTSVAGSTEEHGNGYTDDTDGQTFSAEAYKASGKKWQILDIDEDTGEITLISDLIYQDNTTGGVSDGTMGNTKFYLSNGIGYLWAEEELHRIGAIYGYGYGADTSKTITYYYGGPNDQDGSIAEIDADNDGTIDNLAELQQGRKATLSLGSGGRALTVEDINKICGKDTTYTANYSSSTVTKNSNNAKYYPTLNTTNTTTGQSAEVAEPSGNYYYAYYSYTISSANSDSAVATAQNAILKPGTGFYLGSRCVHPGSAGGYTHYSMFYVSSGEIVNILEMCECLDGEWSETEREYAVRSVVTLESEIQTSDAEYNESTGWNLT